MRFLDPADEPDVAEVNAAWNEFVTRGTLERSRVRPHIARAWRRSVDAGCDPYCARADVLPPIETMALLKREARLIEVAAPFLGALSRAAGADRHAAMLADGSGRVLKIVADLPTLADENFPRAGSLLSEAAAGANGVGTALAEKHYVDLLGPEHYIQGFHPFTCQGVPLTGNSPTPVGVVSMSVRAHKTAEKVRNILFCASEAVQCELLAAELTGYLAASPDYRTTLEALRQDMIQGAASVRLQIELAAHRLASGENATLSLENAYELSTRFKRQAAVWRNLADEVTGAAEPIILSDLVGDFISLMDTEARIAEVSLKPGRIDRVLALDDSRRVLQRLLSAVLGAMQSAQPKTPIVIDVLAEPGEGVLQVRSQSPAGQELTQRIRAPRMK